MDRFNIVVVLSVVLAGGCSGELKTPTTAVTPPASAAREFIPPDGFVYLPPGQVTFAEPSDGEGRAQLPVRLTYGFVLQRTEVTQHQWQEMMGSNPSYFSGCGPQCPVEQVNWFDALLYLNARSREEGLPECYELQRCQEPDPAAGGRWGCHGSYLDDYRWVGCWGGINCKHITFAGLSCRGYRLLTEAEWQYAMAERPDEPKAHAWVWPNAGGVDYQGCLQPGEDGEQDESALGHSRPQGCLGTHPVMTRRPDSRGLYDMLGNVAEWTFLELEPSPKTAGLVDPVGVWSSTQRPTRGGSWQSRDVAEMFEVRGQHPEVRSARVGFRAARTILTGNR